MARGGSVEAHVFEVERLAVDAFHRRSNPVGEFAELRDAAAHERLHVGIVLGTREPLEFMSLPLLFRQDFAARADEMTSEISDFAMKAFVRQGEAERNACFVDHALPAIDAGLDFLDVIVTQAFIQSGEGGNLLGVDFIADYFGDGIHRVAENVIVFEFGFTEAALKTAGVVVGGVGGNVGAVEVERDAVVEIEIALDGLQIDDAEGAHVRGGVDSVFFHDFASALNDAADSAFADKHVVRLFREHEAAGAGEGIETRFSEGAELELAVTVGEEGEHVEGKPVGRGFVESAEDARVVGIAGTAREQGFRFFAAVAAEVAVEEVNHGPEVAAFFDVELENVAEVVERRAREAEHFLLLNGCGLRVALRDHDAAKNGTIFAGHVLPGGLAFVHAEIDLALFVAGLEEDAPTVFGHFNVIELCPAVRLNTDGGAEIDLEIVAFVGTHVVPPTEIGRLPVFQGAL